MKNKNIKTILVLSTVFVAVALVGLGAMAGYQQELDTELDDDLNRGIISERLKNEFRTQGFSLSENVVIKKENDYEWTVVNIAEGRFVNVKKESGKLIISTGEPSESEPLVLPSKLLLRGPRGPSGSIHKDFMQLKPGKTGETYYIFNTRDGGQGELSYKIYMVNLRDEEIAMPEGLNVSIEPSKFMAQPHKNYTSKITVKTSPELLPHELNASTGVIAAKIYTFYLQVTFEGENETIEGDQLGVLVSRGMMPNPRGDFHDTIIRLKSGETKETNYTLHTGEGESGEVNYEIYRIRCVSSENKIPMPEGMDASIEPSKFFAQPNQSYTSKITIETSPELSQGEYVLYMHVDFENGGMNDGWLIVKVV